MNINKQQLLRILLAAVFGISVTFGAIFLGWYLFEQDTAYGVLFVILLSFLMLASNMNSLFPD